MSWKISRPPDDEAVVIVSALLGLVLHRKLWLLIFHIAPPDRSLCSESFVPCYVTTFIFEMIVGLALGICLPGKPVLGWSFSSPTLFHCPICGLFLGSRVKLATTTRCY